MKTISLQICGGWLDLPTSCAQFFPWLRSDMLHSVQNACKKVINAPIPGKNCKTQTKKVRTRVSWNLNSQTTITCMFLLVQHSKFQRRRQTPRKNVSIAKFQPRKMQAWEHQRQIVSKENVSQKRKFYLKFQVLMSQILSLIWLPLTTSDIHA